jgi:hypothetical protein
VELTKEEVNPQVPGSVDSQESLTNGDKGRCLRKYVRSKVVELVDGHPRSNGSDRVRIVYK